MSHAFVPSELSIQLGQMVQVAGPSRAVGQVVGVFDREGASVALVRVAGENVITAAFWELRPMRDERGRVVELAKLVQRNEHYAKALTAINRFTLHQNGLSAEAGKLIKRPTHPFTCGVDSEHAPLYAVYDWSVSRVILRCPDCGYVQTSLGYLEGML